MLVPPKYFSASGRRIKLGSRIIGNILLTETIMPVSKAMMVNPWATILPRIILCKKLLVSATFLIISWTTWLPSLSFLPNLKRPLTRKKVVAPQPASTFSIAVFFFTVSHLWGGRGSPWTSWPASRRAPHPGASYLCLCSLPTLCSTADNLIWMRTASKWLDFK